MKERFRDKTRDDLANALNLIGVKAEMADRERAEEKVENSWYQRSLGVIDIAEGPIRWINILKKDPSKDSPPRWWIVMGIPDDSAVSIRKQIKIKTKRKKLGITQADLSKKLFISPTYLNLMESGKRKIDLDLLLKIASELNVDVSDISKKTDTNLYQNLMDLLGDNLFENLDITNFDVKELVNTNPLIAKALIKLGDNYKKKSRYS